MQLQAHIAREGEQLEEHKRKGQGKFTPALPVLRDSYRRGIKPTAAWGGKMLDPRWLRVIGRIHHTDPARLFGGSTRFEGKVY